jgi:hypothetical protein
MSPQLSLGERRGATGGFLSSANASVQSAPVKASANDVGNKQDNKVIAVPKDHTIKWYSQVAAGLHAFSTHMEVRGQLLAPATLSPVRSRLCLLNGSD